MAPSTTTRPTAKSSQNATTGEKRSHEGDDTPARPAKTRAINFVDGNEVIPRKPRKRVAPSDNPEEAMDDIIDDEAKAKAAAKATREEEEKILSELASTYARPRVSKKDGHVRFFRATYPRFAPTEDFFQLLMKNKQDALELAALLKNGGSVVWTTVYNTQNPEDSHLRRLRTAINHITALGITEGMDATAYLIRPLPKPNGKGNYSPIYITCKTEEAENLLLGLGHFAFRDASGESAFFTQAGVSHRTAVILDVKNAPQEATKLMAGLWKHLHPIIKWKSKDEDAWVPEFFQYTKVAKETTAAHWRIAFRPDPESYLTWTRPETIGINGMRGEVTLEDPPFCQACVSMSHSREHCQWWRAPSITSDPKKPKDPVITKWTAKMIFGATLRGQAQAATGNEPQSEAETERPRSASQTPEPRPAAMIATAQ